MVLRNTLERTRLLRAVAEIQGYTYALEASYESPFDVPSIYQKFGQFLPPQLFANADEPPSSLLDLIQRRATLVLRRQQYHELIDMCRQRLGPDWASTPHGQTLSLLARPAITDESDVIKRALDELFRSLLADTTSVDARATIATALQRIGDVYLGAMNLKACAAPPPEGPSEPFSLFQALLLTETVVNPPGSTKLAWSTRVQPVIQHFLNTTKRNRTIAGPIRNYGAFYERTITNLEVRRPTPNAKPYADFSDSYSFCHIPTNQGMTSTRSTLINSWQLLRAPLLPRGFEVTVRCLTY